MTSNIYLPFFPCLIVILIEPSAVKDLFCQENIIHTIIGLDLLGKFSELQMPTVSENNSQLKSVFVKPVLAPEGQTKWSRFLKEKNVRKEQIVGS